MASRTRLRVRLSAFCRPPARDPRHDRDPRPDLRVVRFAVSGDCRASSDDGRPSSRRRRSSSWRSSRSSRACMTARSIVSARRDAAPTTHSSRPGRRGRAHRTGAAALYVGRWRSPLTTSARRGHGPLWQLDESRQIQPLYAEYGLNDPGLRADIAVRDRHVWPMVVGEFGVIGVLAYSAFLAGIGLALWALGGRPPTQRWPRSSSLLACDSRRQRVDGDADVHVAATELPAVRGPRRDPGHLGSLFGHRWAPSPTRHDQRLAPSSAGSHSGRRGHGPAERVTAICHDIPDAILLRRRSRSRGSHGRRERRRRS